MSQTRWNDPASQNPRWSDDSSRYHGSCYNSSQSRGSNPIQQAAEDDGYSGQSGNRVSQVDGLFVSDSSLNVYRESPIDLGDSEGEAKGQSDYAPTFQAINKPKTHQGPKHKGSIKQPNVNSGSHTPKGEAVKKEKKKKKARDDAKKPLEAQRDKMAMSSRATAFKKAHPGVNCPKKLSREQFKDLTKKHGAGNAS